MKAKPKFLVKFWGPDADEFGVKTVAEAFKLIADKYPEHWPTLNHWRDYRHKAWGSMKIWKSFDDGQAAHSPVADVVKLGGLLACYGKQNPEYPPGASCDTCSLRIACQHALEAP